MGITITRTLRRQLRFRRRPSKQLQAITGRGTSRRKCYIPLLMNIIHRACFLPAALVMIAACGQATNTEIESTPAPSATGFSWIVPGKLAAMPLPGKNRPLEDDAAFLDQEGIQVLVSLTEDPPDGNVLSSEGIDQFHIPVKDFTPPTLEQMIDFVAVVDRASADGRPVGVHCTAGLGRSGTMAAAYLVAVGSTADDAMAKVRQLRPGSIETPEQEDAVRSFERHLAEAR